MDYRGKYELSDFSNLNRYKIGRRKSKVDFKDFHNGKVPNGLSRFIETLPNILKANDLKELLDIMVDGVKNNRQFIIAMGAHVIKCGLSPILINLMKLGILKHLALNSACAIHDFEIAYLGKTSEEVAEGIIDGTFGMAEETGRFINGAAKLSYDKRIGFGEAIAQKMELDEIKGRDRSLIYNSWKYDIPVTIHVAIGTDIVHPHPEFRGEFFGYGSGIDFKIYTKSISKLTKKSIYFNIGSAVILPEVFLKALTTTRNLGYDTFGFYTINCDMKQQYRP
jgi:hypothetical protein